MFRVIYSDNPAEWRKVIERCGDVDVCQLPEYHSAYQSREEHATAVLWVFEEADKVFCYPFFLSDVVLRSIQGTFTTEFKDISSVYGYSGAISSEFSGDFVSKAWSVFDSWAAEQKVVAEFVRFSCFTDNSKLAHPDCEILSNRPAAISLLPDSVEDYSSQLKAKSRNMVRRAQREGLLGKVVPLSKGLDEFRDLYQRTMRRNDSTSFFDYDDRYYDALLSLPDDEVFMSGVYRRNELVSAAIGLRYKDGALYHLGANDSQYMKHGAGNFCLYLMMGKLIDLGVKFVTVGGGRTTSGDDPLFKFKARNATGMTEFKIGKRILDRRAYKYLQQKWVDIGNSVAGPEKLIFYR